MSLKTKALNEKLAYIAREKPVTVPEEASMKDVLSLMRQHAAPCVLVCRGAKLVGIFTERDYLVKAAGQAKPGEPIRQYMTPEPVTAALEQSLGEAVEVMNAKGLRHLPLVDRHGAPASLLTVNVVIQYLADHFPAAVVNRPPQPHVTSEETDGA